MLTATDFLVTDFGPPVVAGERKARGLVPRDLSADPPGMFSPPSEIKLIPRSEWSERIRDAVARKTQISDVRNVADGGRPIAALDQNGQGFCWSYSTTAAVMLSRAMQGQPYVRLSAHGPACVIKGFRDEGGWCGLSAKFARERGIPSVEHWPEKSMSRANDKPATWENAALHRVLEDFCDVSVAVYDQNMSFEMLITCLLSGFPCPVDFNHWGHSVCAMDAVDGVSSFDAGLCRHLVSGKRLSQRQFDKLWDMDGVGAGMGVRILNSWRNEWGLLGTGVLAGSKAVPDGALCLRVTGAAAA